MVTFLSSRMPDAPTEPEVQVPADEAVYTGKSHV